jgi:hypothetical protein
MAVDSSRAAATRRPATHLRDPLSALTLTETLQRLEVLAPEAYHALKLIAEDALRRTLSA